MYMRRWQKRMHRFGKQHTASLLQLQIRDKRCFAYCIGENMHWLL